MTDRPLDFSALMIRAILDGRKTMTRRVLSRANTYRDGMPWRGLPAWEAHDWNDAFVDDGPSPAGNPGPYLKVAYPPDGTRHRIYPIWQPGDRIWVREAWQTLTEYNDRSPKDILRSSYIFYLADREGDGGHWRERRRQSRFMCRWMSRITLTVTEVKVERLQDISEEDAGAEGAPDYAKFVSAVAPYSIGETASEVQSRLRWRQRWFGSFWNELHGPGAWDRNDWVAAIRFTAERRNIDD